ncbi:MAG TPA: SCO family protein [Mucilaginibacter sp.]|nr:SCO family protein [Mucilaginibacter sp.]
MRKLAWVFMVILAASACKFNSNDKKTLPILGSRKLQTRTVDGKTVTDTVYQTITPFKFVNQYGDSITNKSLDADIYVADFFFTTCPSICPVMHRNMLKVYNTFKNTGDFKILSHTIDPKHDSVPVLKRYADKLGVTGNTWWFLQGKKDSTYELAEKHYMVAVKGDSTGAGGYIHSGYFILVDKQKRIRGVYDGTDPKQVDQMIDDIKVLLAEPDEEIAQ